MDTPLRDNKVGAVNQNGYANEEAIHRKDVQVGFLTSGSNLKIAKKLIFNAYVL